MSLPPDYAERVYAGVLGKLIGVYLGRPFEGWTYDRILAELGEIHYYVHQRLAKPLIVTDDDISGTFTFLRALPDYNNSRDLTPAQIGQTWLNYIIEQKTILWWGGMGNSTEHTAFLRLKRGVQAPESGSIARNGQVVAEQIGAQIFIDGWAMVAPGDPELAADLARRAASVSHDGAAIHGAQVLAAMEALAFVEPDLNRLIDAALAVIPRDALIARMINDIRDWHALYPDWRTTRACVDKHYGYHIYGGNCHMVPNHALIHLGLLYGEDDFQRSLMITNTAGWDTDCNSGNVGCLMGIKNGLAGIAAGPDWRGPVADRLYLPTADGGRAVTDAVSETYNVVNIGRALVGQAPLAPKNGARFHFELPGSVQGFQPETSGETQGTVAVENVMGYSQAGSRSLALRYRNLAPGRAARVATPTFTPPEAIGMQGYTLLASPSLYAGQVVRARVVADRDNVMPVTCRLYIRAYAAGDQLEHTFGPAAELGPGDAHDWAWRIGSTDGAPIAEVGVEIVGDNGTSGSVYLDYLTWDGTPDVVFNRPANGGRLWQRAWVAGVDQLTFSHESTYRMVQNEGTGLVIQGTREWRDYRVAAPVRPHMARRAGIAARVQGMRRWYGLLLCVDGMARLVKALDGEQVLAEATCPWELDRTYQLELAVRGREVIGLVDGVEQFRIDDQHQPLSSGAVAMVADEGRVDIQDVRVCA
ncbi:MAG: ADP-ribosylglycohydrolase family protein [Chloroflexota bacterium]|nr:ADP-ribosylglycohydrolase family protein [Chloroflexota bacterium]